MEGGERGVPGRIRLESRDDPCGHVERPRTAEPDDGQSGAPGRGGQRYDRIGKQSITSEGTWGQALRLAFAGLFPGERVFTSTIAFAVRFCRSRASIHCCGMLAMLLTA